MHIPELIPLRNDLAVVAAVVRLLRDAGGHPFLVGGCVRDALLGVTTKDIDIEVYGLGIELCGGPPAVADARGSNNFRFRASFRRFFDG